METVKIVNLTQASFYLKKGIKPVDVYYTDRIVFVFNKKKTKDVWEHWRKNRVEL